MNENDHTDAEFARREHAAEMGEDSPSEKRWMQFCRDCERLLGVESLDGEESEDGFSLDTAHDAFEAGKSPAEYVEGRKPQHIARHIFGEESVAVAAGDDKAVVQGQAIRRVLSINAVGPHDAIGMSQLRGPKRLTDEQWTEFRGIIDNFFKEKGIDA